MDYNIKALFESIRFRANRVVEERDRPYGYSVMTALVEIESDWKRIEQYMLTAPTEK
jgi:hypothetical protein